MNKVLDICYPLCYSLRVVRRERKIMKVGNLVQWVLNCPGFPKRQGTITETFYHNGQLASHRVCWFENGELKSNTFRPRDLEVLV